MTTPLPDAPDLRLLPLDALMEHEYNDDQRTAPLVQRLQVEGALKNPPIVAPLDARQQKFVVLDGANRCTALEQLGYGHVLAQVVHYGPPQVILSTWHHAVTGLEMETFTRALHSVDGLELFTTDTLSARAELARRDLIAYVLCADGQVLAARAPVHNLHRQNRLLNALVDTYKLHGGLHRTIATEIAEAQAVYPDLTALVIFPNYEPAEVLALARDGELLPPGLTRHLIQGRVLRVNFPLTELRAAGTPAEDEARLHQWMQQKFAAREIRFYGESTFLFDE